MSREGCGVIGAGCSVMRCHMIPSHSPSDRTEEDQEFIYEELQNVRAFGHLSNAVSQSVVVMEMI